MAIPTELLSPSIPPPLPGRDASGVRRTPDASDEELALWVEELPDEVGEVEPNDVAVLQEPRPRRRRGLLVVSTILAAVAGALLALATDRLMEPEPADVAPPSFASEPAPIELDPIVIDVPVAR